jgi:glycosyltransferase involved in cell wall biosynthesis
VPQIDKDCEMIANSDKFPFAVILPVTSKNKEEEIFNALEQVAQNLRDNQGDVTPIYVYIGIDDDDLILSGVANNDRIRNIFKGLKTFILQFPPTKPANICEIWRSLAAEACEENCKYFLLYGDDVRIEVEKDLKWTEMVHGHFAGRPNRIGCVALNDQSSAGFPTFPVITEIHMEIFGGNVIPHEFVNQDGDPYIWALYRRFSASLFLPEVRLFNDVGGAELLESTTLYIYPRYERKHIEWKGEILQRGVNEVNIFLNDVDKNDIISTVVTPIVMDIIVPSIRVDKNLLCPIISLINNAPCDVMMIIIVDDPLADIEWLREIEKSETQLGKLRIRKNPSNVGASMTRNVGLNETTADWVLFLDDDVVPRHDLLKHYSDAILKDGANDDGFVGVTRLPDDETNSVFGAGVHLSCVSYFWTCAEKKDITPWGVTANFLFNRTCSNRRQPVGASQHNMNLRFDLDFIKTGGGEDIHFCSQLCKQPMKCVPLAICDHPWWNNGNRCYIHFYRWAIGDSLLIDKLPQFAYYNLPNVIDFTYLMILLSVLHDYNLYGGNLFLRRSPIMLIKLCGLILTLLAIDCTLDVLLCFQDVKHNQLTYNDCKFHIMAAIEGCVIKNSSELGHLIGPIGRGNIFRVGRKFDWFCGTNDKFIPKERLKAFKRLIVFIGITCVYKYMYM